RRRPKVAAGEGAVPESRHLPRRLRHRAEREILAWRVRDRREGTAGRLLLARGPRRAAQGRQGQVDSPGGPAAAPGRRTHQAALPPPPRGRGKEGGKDVRGKQPEKPPHPPEGPEAR